MDYYGTFRAILTELENHPAIEVEQARLLPGHDDLDERLAATGLVLDPDVRAFYRQVGGVQLAWIAPKDADDGRDDELAGSISIHSFEEAFSLGRYAGQWPGLLGLDGLDEHARAQMAGFYPLDYIRDDDQNAVGWIADGARVTSALGLYVMSYRAAFGGPIASIERYVRELAQTRGALSRFDPGRIFADAIGREPYASRFEAIFG